MLIRRQVFFSDIDGEGVERLYSTTEVISEEDYLQREFAFKDYEGLSEAQAKELQKRRSAYAKQLLKAHREEQKGIAKVRRGMVDLTELSSKGTIRAGGVNSEYEVISSGKDLPLHEKRVMTQQLDLSKGAKKMMRENVEKEISGEGPKWKRPSASPKLIDAPKTIKGSSNLPSTVAKTGEALSGSVKKGLSRNAKIGLGVAGGTALLGAGGLAYSHYKNKKKKEN